MCGITGYYNFDQTPIKTNQEVREMLEVQRHRGPDDSGIVFFDLNNKSIEEVTHKEHVELNKKFTGVLGFNRLSILDLSYHGHQPMKNTNEDVILTLNGEVYNVFDYKDELISKGYNFKSTSDTEVVLNLYLEYGLEKMLSLLNGMFAIVIVDLRVSEVIIARDRFGIKPMYYFNENRQFGFSSEIKSFYKIENFKATLNKELLDEFLIFRNVRNQTLINEVKVLPPGHFLRFNVDGIIEITEFFNINNYSRKKSKEKLNTVKNRAKDVLEKSVKSQLISDVKLGCQLSGGVDSSVVTYLANNLVTNKNFESVSIVFDNESFSEEKYIDRVAEQLDIEAHKFEMDSQYYLNQLKKATWHLEGPINHPNTIGIYLLAQRAKEHVTVLLSGEGADEVFGGYSRFHLMKYRYGIQFYKDLMKNVTKAPAFIKEYSNKAIQAVKATAFMPIEIAKQLKPDFNQDKALTPRLNLYNSFNGSVFDKQVKYEISTYIPDLLTRQDKMSMAHSIENRVPFLDNEVVEKSFEYPEDFLIKKEKNHEKYILKELCADFFGKDFAYRDKMGFGIPLKSFFKQKGFNEFLSNEILPSLINRNMFKESVLKKIFSDIDKLSYREIDTLWILISLEVWMQEFIDNQ